MSMTKTSHPASTKAAARSTNLGRGQERGMGSITTSTAHGMKAQGKKGEKRGDPSFTPTAAPTKSLPSTSKTALLFSSLRRRSLEVMSPHTLWERGGVGSQGSGMHMQKKKGKKE